MARDSAPRGARSRVGSLFATFVGVVLLVGLGFSAGLVAGVVAQEPELIAGHLLGRSERVDWSGEPPPAVAAAPPDAGYSVEVAAFERSGAAEGVAEELRGRGYAAEVVPSPGPREQRWQVRVGPLESREEATQLARRLQDAGQRDARVIGIEGG